MFYRRYRYDGKTLSFFMYHKFIFIFDKSNLLLSPTFLGHVLAKHYSDINDFECSQIKDILVKVNTKK